MKEFLKFIKYIIKYNLYKSRYMNITKKQQLKILTTNETIDKINEGFSIARFGDGEFKWMLNIKQNSFQTQNEKLRIRLSEIILNTNNNDKILIAIPDVLVTLENRTIEAKAYWAKFYVDNYKKINNFLNSNTIYGNANLTRVYMGYQNKDKNEIQSKFDKIKTIWNKKDVLIVEGENTKLGIGNDLFDNTNSIQRIICPSTNAFDLYDEILKATIKNANNKIVLISLGPTATVLSYDLSLQNIQALDIGHIDVEYCWFKMGVKKKSAIKGKAVNEVNNNRFDIIDDDNYYKNQIICRIQ